MKKITWPILGILILLSSACNRYKSSDPLCRIVEDKGEQRIKEDDFVALSYSVKFENGTVQYDHYKHLCHRERSDFSGDLNSALGKMSEGDSAVVKVSIDSMVAHRQLESSAALKGKYLIYYLKVNKVITRKGAPGHKSDSLLNTSIENYKQQSIADDRLHETTILQHFLQQSKLKFDSTASGLYYHINTKGAGPKPRPGDIAQVYFTGNYTDSEIFFTNDSLAAKKAFVYSPDKKYGLLDFYIGKQLFIKGFEEGISTMPEGSDATFIIPSKLSNGERYGFLPLVCRVKIVHLRHPKQGERIKMLHEDEGDGEEIH